jgi:hypothetical protein
MKKLILSLFITLFSLSINAQYLQIDNLYVTDVSTPNAIEVTVDVKNHVEFSYIGSSYSIDGNNVNLDLCFFWSIGLDAITTVTKQLYVYLPSDMSYNLSVNIFRSESHTSCDYFEKTDSASLSFNFPFSDTGYLALNTNPVIPNINLYPNPVNRILNINSNGLNVDDLKIYDVFGKLVFFKAKPAKLIDLSELENGIYFVVLNTKQGVIKEKIIVNR